MEWNKKIEDIIKGKKWMRNDSGLWKVQCCKLFRDNEELMILIVADELEGPACARIEKIAVVNNNTELIVFYDNEYDVMLEEDEYENFSEVVSRKEWDVLFEGNATKELIDMGMTLEEEGVYVEPHESVDRFMKNYDEKTSEEIAEHFHL